MFLTPEQLLRGYSTGVFPMAESREHPGIFWVDPRRRGIFPLDRFHISRSLARTIRKEPFRIAVDQEFARVVDGCADRVDTWINAEIHGIYVTLHRLGHAHSLEVWEDMRLVGGVYGVVLGAAFFGESMFSRRRDASKIALAYLVDRLRQAGFTLFDTQFQTEHLASMGVIEISRANYHKRLEHALARRADFTAPRIPTAQAVLQRNTQISYRA
ncbi:MAG: leucyl/phenylalanyl-tRNA--protein transferase [Rhodobacteraceae bacterium]|nr:leucyl/phenylalanyl-tRNA--protein transferase [Paracoccaceae bacterium]